MPVFADAPLLVRETLLFPYLDGARFMQWWDRSPYKDSLPTGARMPASTEQILHPDRYLAHDQPIRLRFTSGPARTYEDGLGEVEIRVLEAQLRGETGLPQTAVPLGWGGDPIWRVRDARWTGHRLVRGVGRRAKRGPLRRDDRTPARCARSTRRTRRGSSGLPLDGRPGSRFVDGARGVGALESAAGGDYRPLTARTRRLALTPSCGYSSGLMFDELSAKLNATLQQAHRPRRPHRGRGQGRAARNPADPARSRRQLRPDPRVSRAGAGQGRRRHRAQGRPARAPARQDRLRRAGGAARREAGAARLRLGSADRSILIVGLQGSGKTTTAGKLAKRLKLEQKAPFLVAADVYRPAAVRSSSQTLAQAGGRGRARRARRHRRRRHRQARHRGGGQGAGAHGHRRHRGPAADRRRDDGRADAAQGGGQAARDPARRRRNDGPGRGPHRAGLPRRARHHRRRC